MIPTIKKKFRLFRNIYTSFEAWKLRLAGRGDSMTDVLLCWKAAAGTVSKKMAPNIKFQILF